MQLQSLRIHLGRLARELGGTIEIGERRYRVKGYLASQFATDLHHERHLEKPLRAAMAERPGPILDVGVNNGQTLLRILSIDPNRRYVGFEPQFACCALTQRFIRDNGLENAMIVGIALSDCDRLLPIFAEGAYDEMASLIEHSRSRYDRVAARQFVPARRGDDVIAELDLPQPAIIKVDVEGAELSVFRGFSETIARGRPICLFEVLPNFAGVQRLRIDQEIAAVNRQAAVAIFEFFRDTGYCIKQIDAAGEQFPIEAFDLDTPSTYRGSDYVAHPT